MPALVKGGEDALHRPHAGAEVANRQTDRSWRAVGLAGHVGTDGGLCPSQLPFAIPAGSGSTEWIASFAAS